MPDLTLEEAAAKTGVELEPVAPAALFHTSDPVEVVEQATRVADALAAVIQSKQLFTIIQGKPHVRVEGWQLLGSMLGVTAVCTATEPVEGGYKATVEARTADGRVIGRADALCTKMEKRGPWKSADDYARLSMAQTRATSKALKGPLGFVVSLAGYETTPAEEMTFAVAEAEVVPDPPQPAKPIPAKRAKDLTAAVESAGLTSQLPMAVGHVTGVSLATVEAATDLMKKLTPEQADAIQRWVDKHSEPAA